jgi:hypothetical protein
MRYHLRTLLILLAVAPPVLAFGWSTYRQRRDLRDLEEWNYAPTEFHPAIVWLDEQHCPILFAGGDQPPPR